MTDRWADDVGGFIDRMLKDGEFLMVDLVLQYFAGRATVEQTLLILTATLPAKKRLGNRQQMIDVFKLAWPASVQLPEGLE